ncbi:MAG: AMP-binding protein [Nostoc sp.]
MLVEWNNTVTPYPKDYCFHQLFEQQVQRTPEVTAVVFDNRHLTYQELDRQANQLAHYLQKIGVDSKVLVGLCVERSLDDGKTMLPDNSCKFFSC